MRPFVPLFNNPHLLTIAAHVWPRRLDERRYPIRRTLYRTDPETQVLVEEQHPEGGRRGAVVLVHGLESSSRAGYMRSLAQAALDAGFSAHRLNLRSCGGTEALCRTSYHSGLTCDLEAVARAQPPPVYVAGFSLGGNVALKLAGELGEAARGWLAGVCAVSPPIDLAACAARLAERKNRIYEARFLRSLKRRAPGRCAGVRSIREFDDRITAPAFGFRDAAEYYDTQSASGFLREIRVPALLIQAQDDPLIPFAVFEKLDASRVQLLATERGGHVGFLARRRPRFWLDEVIVEWITGN